MLYKLSFQKNSVTLWKLPPYLISKINKSGLCLIYVGSSNVSSYSADYDIGLWTKYVSFEDCGKSYITKY